MSMAKQQGASLIETMVMLLLASLMSLLLFSSWRYSSQAFRQSSQQSQLQQAGSFVLSLFRQELANSHFFAGKSASTLPISDFASPTADCGSLIDSGTFIRANLPWVSLFAGTVGQLSMPLCLTNALKGSDFLQIKRLAGDPTGAAALKQNRVYLEQQGNLARFVTNQSSNLQPAALYWPYLHQVFYITEQKLQQQKVPVLMRKRLVRQLSGALQMDTSAVIDGVEMLVFEAGIDSNDDGWPDYFLPADQVPAAIWQQQQGRVMQMRFYVLLRSVDADVSYRNTQKYQLGHRSFIAKGDHYRRLLISSSVRFINP